MMFNKSKNRILRDICQNHSARSDRDVSRVCPTKLTRQELEDIYYTLIDDNFHMKKKITTLEDKVKTLSTKLLKKTNSQRSSILKEKDCYSASKALLLEQKEQIEDLHSANRKLVERIKLLKMQMCSAKQFFSTSSQGTRCPKCFIRNSTIALNYKRSETSLKASTTCQYIDKEVMTSRSIQSSVSVNTESPDKVILNESFDQKKHVIQEEQMMQKIADLEQELKKATEKYATDISKLEQLGISLRQDNVNLRSQITLKEEMLQDLSDKIRTMEINHSELSSQLILEKQKVTELETELKVYSVSGNVTRAIEDHLAKVKVDAVKEQIELKKQLDRLEVKNDHHGSKYSDDSGFTETKSSDSDNQFLAKQNKELLRQIDDLQIKIEALQNDNIQMKQKLETPSPKRHTTSSVESKVQSCRSIDADVVRNNSVVDKLSSIPVAQDLCDSDTKHNTIKGNDVENEQFASFFVNIENTSSPNVKMPNPERKTNKDIAVVPEALDTVKASPKKSTVNELSRKKSSDSDSDRKDRTRTLSNSPQGKPSSKKDIPVITIATPIKTNERLTEMEMQKAIDKQRRSSSGSAKTYVMPGSGKLSRVSKQESPDNTDCEISSLSDLPSERNDRHPPSILSPGEDRMRPYSSETFQTTTTDYGSLSEGELPGFRIERQLSVGEKQIGGFINRDFNGTRSASEMQRAVAAAASELARCRRLLNCNKRIP